MIKKKVSLILVAVLAVVICMALLVNYKTDNLGQPAICASIDENGNCTGTATTFAADVKQVVFVCQRKKPFIGNATISWYSDNDNNTPIKTETVSANKAGYALVLAVGMNPLDPLFLAAIVIGAVGTFLFVYSLSGALLFFMSRNRKVYCKGLNIFVLR